MLNNFLKFERKIYQVFGLQLGRALSVKAVIYFLVIGVIEIIIYNLPVIGNLINWLPLSILLMIPIGLAWLLADVGTEGRSPVYFFRSFFAYQKRKYIDKTTLFRGRQISKPSDYQFRNYMTICVPNDENDILPMEYVDIEEDNYIHSAKANLNANEVNDTDNKESTTSENNEQPIEENGTLKNYQALEGHRHAVEEPGIETNIEKELPKNETEESVNFVVEQEEARQSENQSSDNPSLQQQALNIENETTVNSEMPFKEIDSDNPIKQEAKAVPVLNVIRIEKPKSQKTSVSEITSKEKEEKTSVFRFLVMAMRYRSRVKTTKAKSKKKAR